MYGIIICLCSGLFYSIEAIIMANASEIDNLVITHYYSLFSCCAIALIGCNDSWNTSKTVDFILLFILGIIGSLG